MLDDVLVQLLIALLNCDSLIALLKINATFYSLQIAFLYKHLTEIIQAKAFSDVSVWTNNFWKAFENASVDGECFKTKMQLSDVSRLMWT